jgi:hypothetical protein
MPVLKTSKSRTVLFISNQAVSVKPVGQDTSYYMTDASPNVRMIVYVLVLLYVLPEEL